MAEKLLLAFDQVAGDGLQSISPAAVGREGGKGLFDQASGVALALLDAKDGRPGSFFRGLVLAGCLAQMRGVYGQIQHVIDDLEGQAGLAAEESEEGNIFQIG